MPDSTTAILQEHSTIRRTLLKSGFAAVGACYASAIGYPVYRYLATASVRARAQGQVTSVSIPQKDLPGAGSATMFLFGPRPSLLIHHEDGQYVAFDAVCTHLGCTVRFEPDNNRIFCPCHGGTYDINTGAVLAGPPPAPLKSFRVEVADGNVTISRV